MKLLILCIAALGAVRANTSAWTQIRMKFSFNGALNNIENFWIIYNNQTAAVANGWSPVSNVADFSMTTLCISQTNVRVCALYNIYGFISGVQFAIPTADVEGKGIPYNFGNIPQFQNKTINGIQHWTSTVLVVNPAGMILGGRTSFTSLGEGLWFKNGSSYTEVPTTESLIPTTTLYNKQNCIPAMGTHYYYNIKNSTACDQFYPFFVMTKNGSVNGMGWQIFGRTSVSGRNWYEAVGRQSAELAIPLANKCVGDWADLYGTISIHMYFVEAPWTSTCDQATESSVPITGLSKFGLDTAALFSNVIDNIRFLLHLY